MSGPIRYFSLLVILAAFWLRIYQLDSQSLRGDEAATVLYSAMPLAELWELSRVTDPHPPLYYAMLHPWQRWAGEGAWAMRFAGVWASTLAVAALYGLAYRTLRWNRVSLLAALLLAINPLQIWLAQDIRSYPFFTLLGLLSSWALWQALSVTSGQLSVISSQLSVVSGQTQLSIMSGYQPRTTHQPASRITHHASRFTSWFIYVFLTVACFYIHYYTIFLIAFQGLFVLANFRRFWSQKWPWLTSQVIIGLLIIPGLQLAYKFAGGEAGGGIDTLPVPAILRLASTALLTGFTIGDGWGFWLSLLLLPVWIIGLMALLRRNRLAGSFWALFFTVPVLGVIALSIDRPLFKERFLIQAQPAFMVLLAAGLVVLYQLAIKINNKKLESKKNELTFTLVPKLSLGTRVENKKLESRNNELTLRRPRSFSFFTSYASLLTPYFLLLTPFLLLGTLLLANTAALYNYWANPAYAKAPPWRLYHDYVSDQARPGDVMLTNFPEASVSYYSPNELPFYVVPTERDLTPESRQEQTAQIAGAYQRVWFLPLLRQGFDQQGDVLNWLDRHTDRVNQVFFPDYHLNLYLTPPTIEASLINQPATFEQGLSLRGYQIFDKDGDSRLTPPSPPPSTGGVGGDYLLTLKPGDPFTLSLYWQANGPTEFPYTVFVHLIAADGFNRTGQDNPPVWGSYPTTLWQPGEKIVDKYTLTIPTGTPPGDHRLHIGWYNPAIGQRQSVLDDQGQPAADYVMLDVLIRVEASERP